MLGKSKQELCVDVRVCMSILPLHLLLETLMGYRSTRHIDWSIPSDFYLMFSHKQVRNSILTLI